MTNAERIRQMTDDELFVFLGSVGTFIHACPESRKGKACGPITPCDKCWLEWLQQEANDD